MNSKLVNNSYKIPDEILEFITQTLNQLNGNYVYGVDRAKKLLTDKTVTYGQLKKIIHELSHKIEPNSTQYNLCGGDLMKEWSRRFLDGERSLVKNKKDSKINTDNETSNIRDVKRLNVDTNSKSYNSPIILKGDNQSLFEEINKIKNIIKCQRN